MTSLDGSLAGHRDDQDRVRELLARMRTQTFYMMQRTFVRPDLVAPALLSHLEWLISLEKQGSVLLSGPLRDAGGDMRGGVTVFRCAGLDEAVRLADGDPLIVAGAVTCEVNEWQVNEGRITLSVDLSDGEIRVA